MKHLKMLGLAAIAALGLMAFVGVGTASATTLFTDSAKTIAYPEGTEGEMTLKTGTSASLMDTSGNTIATCTWRRINWKIIGKIAAAVAAVITIFEHGNCSQTTDNVNLGSLEITWTSGSNGSVVGKGTNVTFQVFGVSCTYGTGEGTTLGTITGGTAPELAINAKLAKSAGGFLCPSTSVWQETYIVTSPHALFVGS